MEKTFFAIKRTDIKTSEEEFYLSEYFEVQSIIDDPKKCFIEFFDLETTQRISKLCLKLTDNLFYDTEENFITYFVSCFNEYSEAKLFVEIQKNLTS